MAWGQILSVWQIGICQSQYENLCDDLLLIMRTVKQKINLSAGIPSSMQTIQKCHWNIDNCCFFKDYVKSNTMFKKNKMQTGCICVKWFWSRAPRWTFWMVKSMKSLLHTTTSLWLFQNKWCGSDRNFYFFVQPSDDFIHSKNGNWVTHTTQIIIFFPYYYYHKKVARFWP